MAVTTVVTTLSKKLTLLFISYVNINSKLRVWACACLCVSQCMRGCVCACAYGLSAPETMASKVEASARMDTSKMLRLWRQSAGHSRRSENPAFSYQWAATLPTQASHCRKKKERLFQQLWLRSTSAGDIRCTLVRTSAASAERPRNEDEGSRLGKLEAESTSRKTQRSVRSGGQKRNAAATQLWQRPLRKEDRCGGNNVPCLFSLRLRNTDPFCAGWRVTL